MRNLLRRLRPPLYYDHPGYFKLVVALLIAHLGLGFDALFRASHPEVLWQYVQSFVHGHIGIIAGLHFGIVGLVLIGLSQPKFFRLSRIGWFASFAFFNFLGAGFLAAAIFHAAVSFYPAVAALFMGLTALTAALEPSVNPASIVSNPSLFTVQQPAKKAVLVVDDDSDIIQLVSLVLVHHRYIPILRNSDFEALLTKSAWTGVYAACIDLRLTGFEGLTGGVRILEFLQDHIPNVRRIVITAYSPVPMRVVELAHAVVEKPFTAQELITAIEGG